jgi:hypothetical protein
VTYDTNVRLTWFVIPDGAKRGSGIQGRNARAVALDAAFAGMTIGVNTRLGGMISAGR